MKGNKGGRVAADGAEIIATQTVRLSLDQVSKDVLEQFLEEADGNIGLAFRLLCHAYVAKQSKTAGGPVRAITAAGAGERAEVTGGHRKRTTGAADAVMKMPVLRVVPERNPETGARWSMHKLVQLEAEAQAEYEEAMKRYRAAGGAG